MVSLSLSDSPHAVIMALRMSVLLKFPLFSGLPKSLAFPLPFSLFHIGQSLMKYSVLPHLWHSRLDFVLLSLLFLWFEYLLLLKNFLNFRTSIAAFSSSHSDSSCSAAARASPLFLELSVVPKYNSWVIREPANSSQLNYLKSLDSCMAVTLALQRLSWGRLLRIFLTCSSVGIILPREISSFVMLVNLVNISWMLSLKIQCIIQE